MIPVNLDDVLESLTIAQNVYKSGFRNASNPSKSLRCPCSGSLKALKIVDPSYKSFGEDIRQLAINLDLLFDVLQRALSHSGGPEKARQSPNPSFDNHILGDLKGTISTCDAERHTEYFPSLRRRLKRSDNGHETNTWSDPRPFESVYQQPIHCPLATELS